ncbi:DNA topoisomerase IB [Blastomonas aquatica]|uniref:DNA topoisomerase n=1 Tax=Blastomonas aquatica TaxID=1510276 RepID=A0ABQ1IXS0_9SPHN|nr:DNA topoisomerase IB [Blastomonas aquatica]GGB54751.1 DNA topoisomerase [Blastomonas aquatica]
MARDDKDGLGDPAAVPVLEGGLVYTQDDTPGITRVKRGRGFSYHRPDGALIKDDKTLDRIRMLAIPPAYQNVWICPKPNGHVQATGRDARNRKQYRYHPDYRAAQDQAKFSRLALFGAALPAIRAQLDADLRARSTSRRCVIATIILLLDSTAIRIGNAMYAQQNRSYGLTTLRHRHVSLESSTIRFRFAGKGGRKWDVSLRNRRVARVIRGLQDLPGQQLFRYLDGDTVRAITSDDINGYLREIGGEDFSAKDFRTWSGTVTAAVALAELHQLEEPPKVAAAIKLAVLAASQALQNTPTICRKSYIHPAVFDTYSIDQALFAKMAGEDAEEQVLALLRAAENQGKQGTKPTTKRG